MQQLQDNNLLDKAISIINNGRKKVVEAIYNESILTPRKAAQDIIQE
jgi:hypothetical protein